MTHAKIPQVNWMIARARWEGEPRCSYSDLAGFLEISKQAVAKRAAKDCWRKKVIMAAIVGKAHVAADRKISREAAVPSNGSGPVVARGNPGALDQAAAIVLGPLPDSKNTAPEMLAQAVEDVAVDARAQILTRHRNEWPAVRSQLYKAIRAQDIDGARLAKIAAESLKLVQDGERKAWGIDAVGDDKSVRIVIERTEGVRVVR